MEALNLPIDDSEDMKTLRVQYLNFEVSSVREISSKTRDTRDEHDVHKIEREHRPPSKCCELGTIECRTFDPEFQLAF